MDREAVREFFLPRREGCGAQFALGRFLLGTVDDHLFRLISFKSGVFLQVAARGKGESPFVIDPFIVSPTRVGAA